MDLLYEIVNGFDANEEKLLSKYLSFKTPGSGKVIQLFKLLRRGEKMDREQIISTIYGKGKEEDKAVVHAYYQLRLRLNEKIESFILEQVHKEDTGAYVKNLISIAHFLFRRKLYKLAWHYIRKAEDLAINIEQFEVLNLVYALQIEYIWAPDAPPVEELIKKRNHNLLMAKKEGDLNAAFALIHRRLTEARASGDNLDVNSIIQGVFKAFNIDKATMKDPSFKYKTAVIAGYSLYEKKDFQALEKFLIKTYEEMEQGEMFDRHNYRDKIALLANIGMVTIKNKKYELSEKYFDSFHKEHLNYYAQVLPNVYYIINISYVYVCTGRYEQAKKMLLQLQAQYETKLSLEELNELYMNLTAIYVIEENYSMAVKCLQPIQQNEKTFLKQFGIEGAFKRDMIECMIHFDMKNQEYIIYRLYSIGRKFKDYLSDPAHFRDKTFVKLFRQINKDSELLTDSKYIAEVNQFIAMKPIEPGDSEFVSFNAWLKAKIEGREYYEVFLEMVG